MIDGRPHAILASFDLLKATVCSKIGPVDVNSLIFERRVPLFEKR